MWGIQGRRVRGSRTVVVLGVLMLAVAWVWGYESYHDPGLNDQGYCATCHPGFGGGRADTLHVLHVGGRDAITSNCNLCHAGTGKDNPLTMWSNGDDSNGLGCAGCHGRDYGQTVEADYRGFTITGLTKNSGWGLRAHHAANGVGVCATCHSDGATNAPTADDGTPAPENVMDPTPGTSTPIHYYFRADVGLGDAAVDPCTNEDTENDADTLGLDNDGDNLYDATSDPDCQAAVPTPGEVSGSTLNQMVVTAHDPAAQTLAVSYDAAGACLVTDDSLVVGGLTGPFTYAYDTTLFNCSIGASGFHTWNYSTFPASFFWLIVGNDGGSWEGSYGTDFSGGANGERPPSAHCGFVQNLANRCD